jgi:hypothetical protein
MKYSFIIGAVSLLFVACNSHTDSSESVATYKDLHLTKSELISMMPVPYSAADSADIAGKIIQLWIEKACWLDQAEHSTWTEEEEKQLNDYKESLMIQHYQAELIKEKLDTNVKTEEIDHWMSQLADTNQKFTPRQVKDFILMGRKSKIISDLQEGFIKEAQDQGQVQIGGSK